MPCGRYGKELPNFPAPAPADCSPGGAMESGSPSRHAGRPPASRRPHRGRWSPARRQPGRQSVKPQADKESEGPRALSGTAPVAAAEPVRPTCRRSRKAVDRCPPTTGELPGGKCGLAPRIFPTPRRRCRTRWNSWLRPDEAAGGFGNMGEVPFRGAAGPGSRKPPGSGRSRPGVRARPGRPGGSGGNPGLSQPSSRRLPAVRPACGR